MSQLWMYLRGAKKVKTIRSEGRELTVGCFSLLFLTGLLVYLVWRFL